MAEDATIREQISQAEAELRAVRESQSQGATPAAEAHQRIAELERKIDQLWDLIRQREAQRDAGRDPDNARIRPTGEVEGYIG